MTFKNATARLPHGGAKAGIVADPAMSAAQKEQTIRWYTNTIGPLTGYIPGPDMGTDERAMAWVHDEIGRSVGLPASLGGIPLDELGATAFGLAVAAEAAHAAGVVDLVGARVAVQGFGAVGRHAARFLADRGAVLVAASDSRGAVVRGSGLSVDDLGAWKDSGRHFDTYEGEHVERDALAGVDCDIFVPAARPDAITEANVDTVRARGSCCRARTLR